MHDETRELQRLRERGHRRRFERGEILMLEGDFTGRVIVIESGFVKVFASTEDGDEVLLTIRGPGDILGEMSALDGQPRSASVAALTEVEAHVLAGSDFEAILDEIPGLAARLARDLSARLREADEARTTGAAYPVPARVAKLLVLLADRFGSEVGAATAIEVPLSQTDLARWTGATREAVSRAIGTFRDAGLIETARKRVLILDRAGLEKRTLV